MNSPIKIAIIGAGPAGCTLARLLLHKRNETALNISVTLFEAEQSLDFRSQGGTLDLHEKTGQLALKTAGLWDEFLRDARYEGEAFKISDKNLLLYLNIPGPKPGEKTSKTGRPEIDRPQLRRLLYESLPEGVVRWNHKLVKVDENNALHFTDGTIEAGFDLVVGADGAWSKVRSSRISDVKPFYSGIAGHTLTVPNAAETLPDMWELINRGSLFSWSDGKGIFAQCMSDGSFNVAMWAVHSDTWQRDCGYDVHDSQALQGAWNDQYARWAPKLQSLYRNADPSSYVVRDLYMLPIGFQWDHVPGVTILGDAAHLATPFAGEGVNLAMEDALKLATTILAAKDKSDLDARVAGFEKDMFVRATAIQQLTKDMLDCIFHVPGSPRTGIQDYISAAIGHGHNAITRGLTRAAAHTYYFFYNMTHQPSSPA